MPLYEYECTVCRRHTEKIQKFSDPEITQCPFCGGALKRVISAPAFALKGGGWYADGYGNAKPAAAAESSGKEGGGKEGGAKDGAAKETSGNAGTPKEAPAAPAAASAPAAAAPSTAAADKK